MSHNLEDLVQKIEEKVSFNAWNTDPENVEDIKVEIDLLMMEAGLNKDQKVRLKRAKGQLNDVESRPFFNGRFPFLIQSPVYR